MTKFVEASKNAIEETKFAPFLNKDFVDASAAKLQELERKPKNVPNATLLGPSLPITFCIRSLVTST